MAVQLFLNVFWVWIFFDDDVFDMPKQIFLFLLYHLQVQGRLRKEIQDKSA